MLSYLNQMKVVKMALQVLPANLVDAQAKQQQSMDFAVIIKSIYVKWMNYMTYWKVKDDYKGLWKIQGPCFYITGLKWIGKMFWNRQTEPQGYPEGVQRYVKGEVCL